MNITSGGAFKSGALPFISRTALHRKYGARAPKRPPDPNSAAASPYLSGGFWSRAFFHARREASTSHAESLCAVASKPASRLAMMAKIRAEPSIFETRSIKAKRGRRLAGVLPQFVSRSKPTTALASGLPGTRSHHPACDSGLRPGRGSSGFGVVPGFGVSPPSPDSFELAREPR